MNKYYLILFLFIVLGCGNSPSSDNKKAVLSEKQAIENSEMNRKVVKDKIPKIIKECILSKPLKPSIKLDPLIINKKHKQTKNNAKISILIK